MLNIQPAAKSIQPDSVALGQAWNFIDRIYCITLDHRPDRMQQAMDQFRKVGLDDRVEFMVGKKHPTNAEQGNFIAQMNCLRAGVDAGAKTILIFEDDIIFDRFSLTKLNQAQNFIRVCKDWKILFFGCLVKSSRRTPHPSIISVRFRSLTHGYLITREFAQQLLQIPWPGRCMDDLICSLNDPALYAIHPAIAFQSNSRTDNDKQIMNDRIRRALGGLAFLQKLNEFSSLNFRRLVWIHVAVVSLMIVTAVSIHFRYLLHR